MSLRRIALGLHRKRVAKEARAKVAAQVAADRDDYERRWLAECRAHGDTRRELAAACHELGLHTHCDPRECEGEP